MGRDVACAITRAICSRLALSHPVKHAESRSRRFRVPKRCCRRGDHGALVFFDAPFSSAARSDGSGLPVEQKNLRETGARLALDFTVELDKGRASALASFAPSVDLPDAKSMSAIRSCARRVRCRNRAQAATHGGEGSAAADASEIAGRESQLHDVAESSASSSGEREIESCCDLAQQKDRNVALSAFELRE